MRNLSGWIISLLLITLGSVVLLGWFFQIPPLVQIIPGFVGMVPNTATNFILLGVFFLLNASHPVQHLIQKIILIIVLTIACLSLLQDIFHYQLGIDHIINTTWLSDPNPTPGRMAPNTSIAFLIAAIIGLLIPYGRRKSIALMVQFFTLLIFVIAIIALLVYSLKLEFIFTWYRYTRMAVHTATGFILLSLGFWNYWSGSSWYYEFYQGKEDKKIIFITGTILLCLTLISGLGGIAGLTYYNILSIHKSLEKNLQEKINIFQSELDTIQANVNSMSHNPLFVSNNIFLDSSVDNILNFFISNGFTGIEVIGADGKIIKKEGAMNSTALQAPLNLSYKSAIYWQNGFWFTAKIPVWGSSNKPIYYLNLEKPLQTFTQAYRNYKEQGITGHTLVCFRIKNSANCFPSRFSEAPLFFSLNKPGIPLPIVDALDGKSGVVNTIDYRQKSAIAAYNNLAHLGLAFIVQVETSEVYKPIHDQLRVVLPIGLLLIIAGLLLLNWQVVPLVNKVIKSEQEAQQSEMKAISAIKKLEEKNREIFLLRELSSALQSSINLVEANILIQQYAIKLLPSLSGSLYIMDASHHYLEASISWGNSYLKESVLKPEDCWALRRGILHKVEDPKKDLQCPHNRALGDNCPPYVCIPLLAQSDVLGLLYLEWTPNGNGQRYKEQLATALMLSEQIALAVSNLKLRESLRNQSIRDPLTGLYNRRYLEETLDRELERVERKEGTLVAIMIDIDFFKHFNDEFGHEAGDLVLKSVGDILLKNIRSMDIACRYGGEEFLLILPELQEDIARNRADELNKEFKDLNLYYASKPLGAITVSMGIAIFPEDAKNINDLIHASDVALYAAKNSGRNKIVLFSEIKNPK